MKRIGYNVLSHVPELRGHFKQAQLGCMVYFDETEAYWAAQTYPEAYIIYRDWPDEGAHLRMTPDQFIDKHVNLAGTGVIVQTVNESGFEPGIIAWHVALLKRLKERKIKLRVGILALNVGTPKPDELWLADELWQLCIEMKGQVYVVLHEYYGGVVTSGFIGGDPNNAGVAHGQPGGTNLIPTDKWPDNPQSLTLWHVGRYKFIRDYCVGKFGKSPLFIIGEWGADYLSDVDAWLKTLHSTEGAYDVVAGWRELVNQWAEWYPGKPAIEVYFVMLRYADLYIYDENVVGIALFCIGGTDPKWQDYRVDPEFYPIAVNYSSAVLITTPPPTVEIPPIVTPIDDDDPTQPITVVFQPAWKQNTHTGDWNVNVRQFPKSTAAKIGSLKHNVPFWWIELPISAGDWVLVIVDNDVVGYAKREVIQFS